MFQYPYGDSQQLNLDWLIEQWQETKASIDGSLQGEIDRVEAAITDLMTARDQAVAAQTAAETAATSASGYAGTASTAASTATAQATAAAASAALAGSHASNAQTSETNAGLQATAAGNSASAAAVSEGNARNSELTAAAFSSAAAGNALYAEGMAKGTQNGTPVTSGSPYYENNAAYWAGEAQAYDSDAAAAADYAEAMAKGTVNGTPVASGEPGYEDNAEYYKDQAAAQAAAASAASADGTNAQKMIAAPEEASSTATAAHAAGTYFRYNSKLYKATQDIAVGNTITPNTNCIEATVGAELTAQSEAITQIDNDIYDESTGWVSFNFSTETQKLDTFHTNNPTSPTLTIGYNASYDTYIWIAEESGKLWVDNSANKYVALGICPKPTTPWTEVSANAWQITGTTGYNASRLRSSDSNLPTQASPLTYEAGTGFSLSITKGFTPVVYVEGAKKFPKSKISVDVGESKIGIKAEKYSVELSKLTTNVGYEWNITSLSGKGSNVLPVGTDIIGVMQLSGKSDFMGGLHGNESNYEFKLLSGGSVITESCICDDLNVIMYSHLYDVEDSTDNVVDRFVILEFTPDGWTCRNTFKILENCTVQNCYASGLFAFSPSACSGAYTNLGGVDFTQTESRQYEDEDLKEITINITDNLTVKLISYVSDYGFITYRDASSTFKLYFQNAHNVAKTAGDYISGYSEYRF